MVNSYYDQVWVSLTERIYNQYQQPGSTPLDVPQGPGQQEGYDAKSPELDPELDSKVRRRAAATQ